MSRAGASRVVVTGIGIISPIGNTPEEVSRSILGGVSAVRQCAETIRGKPVFAGKIKLDLPDDPAVDRTGQLAIEAARRALADAFGGGSGAVDPLRIGLALGTSHGGRSQLDRLAEDDGDPFAARAASRFAAVGTHHAQTTAVVSALGLGGPTVTLSNACGSSGSALEVGFDWVRSGSCAAAIVGGADGYAHLTQAGFAALGATSPGPNAPFSLPVGISLGEAAGFVILETLDAALARGATVRAEIFACASTWDAYHLTEPEPSGDGLGRALERAAARAGWDAARIGFVHAHGTGTRMNDAAECRALTRFFGADVPPVCSSKSMTGHVLGASAVVGLVVGIVAMNQGVIPPTVNFQEPRPGCGFDFVPNVPRVAAVSGFAVEVAGFGGANAVALVGLPGPRNAAGGPVDRLDDVVITGVGVVSPLGFDGATLADAAAAGRSGIVPLDRFEVNQRAARHGALLHGATVRKRASSLGLRRADAVVEYAAVAADDACRQAGWATLTADVGARIGLVVGTTRGEASRFEAYLESARGGVWERASPLHFPHLVMSALGGQVSKALGLKGTALTVVDGDAAGLHALCHAAEMLRRHDDLDAIVVVAADELAPRLFGCLDRLGRLAPSPDDGRIPALRPYDPAARGAVAGEGAAALVLERATVARRRGAAVLARVDGHGLAAAPGPNDLAATVARAANAALSASGCDGASVDLVIGCGRGRPAYDGAEGAGIAAALTGRAAPCPATALASALGVAEAASGLFAVVAALSALARQEAPPVSAPTPPDPPGGNLAWIGPGPRAGDYRRVLVAGGSDAGNIAAVVLSRPETDS